MGIENKCIQSGCPGYCCFDTDIEVTASELKRLFPRAVRLNTLKELRSSDLPQGFAFYARLRKKDLGNSGFFEIGWSGKCPNMDSKGHCTKYSERSHAARHFSLGSKECNEVRSEYGLPPIYKEPVE